MNKNRFSFLSCLVLILAMLMGCGDDEPTPAIPFINLVGGDVTLKPDSSTIFQVEINAISSFSETNLTLDVTGNGAASITSVTGSGSMTGTAEIAFTAGGEANENANLLLEVTDDQGLTGQLTIEVTITDLDFPVVYVLNEGNFFSANGSISSYAFRSSEVEQGVYEAEATIQNARSFGSELFVVTNAPNKVDVLALDFTLSATVDEGLDNPIDIAVVEDLAYVTNWGDIGTAFTDDPDSYVAIVDLSSSSVVDSILLDQRPQDILAVGGSLYVTHESASVISVINTSDNSVATLTTPFGPSEMALNSNGDLLVLCTGGSLIEIDSEDNIVTTILDGLTTSAFNEKMTLDVERNVLYFLGAGNADFTGQTTVFAVALDEATPMATPFATGGAALYGIGLNPETNQVFVGDNNSFISTGTTFIYNSEGTLIDEFATGIGPNGFLFL